jgi:hypothetical protein
MIISVISTDRSVPLLFLSSYFMKEFITNFFSTKGECFQARLQINYLQKQL